jgi:hypothetical protein
MWSDFVDDWRNMLDAYKKDHSKPNPFEEPNPGNSTDGCQFDSRLNGSVDDALRELKAQLVNDDLEKTMAGNVFPHSVSPAVFLQQALDIEAAQ